MVKYENGKIYKLLLPDGYYYIGCTCNELKVRKQQHKDNCLCESRECLLYRYIRENKFEWKDIKIVLFENYPCENKSELLLKESVTIRNFIKDSFCLNSNCNTSLDGSKQEHNKTITKKYREENKEKISEQRKNYYINIEKNKIKENIDKIREKRKLYYESVKDSKLEKITCECGSVICKSALSKHLKSNKHKLLS